MQSAFPIYQRGAMLMIKSWFNRLIGRSEDSVDRRRERSSPAVEVSPEDIDPLTGALRWERFMAIFNAEQEQAPGVLLVIDLSTHSDSIDMIAADGREEILPWLAQAIRAAIRSDDLLAHVTDYRFATLLRAAPQELAEEISKRITDSVDNTIFMTAEGIAKLGVTIGGSRFAEKDGSAALGTALANLEQARGRGASSIIQ